MYEKRFLEIYFLGICRGSNIQMKKKKLLGFISTETARVDDKLCYCTEILLGISGDVFALVGEALSSSVSENLGWPRGFLRQ